MARYAVLAVVLFQYAIGAFLVKEGAPIAK